MALLFNSDLERQLLTLQAEVRALHESTGVLRERLHQLETERLGWEKVIMVCGVVGILIGAALTIGVTFLLDHLWPSQ